MRTEAGYDFSAGNQEQGCTRRVPSSLTTNHVLKSEGIHMMISVFFNVHLNAC